MSPINVLLTDALDIYGGGEFFVLELAEFLKNRECKIWVSCVIDSILHKKCAEKSINVFPLAYPRSGKGSLVKNTNMLRHFIRENRIHLVHTNTNYDRTAGAFAAKRSGANHITSVHSLQSVSHNLTHWYRNKYLTSAFIADGNKIREVLTQQDKIPAAKVALIHPGIDPETMKRKQSLRGQVRTEFNLEDRHVLIGNVGRMVEFKGQEYLLRAFAGLTEIFPDARLMIVGSGELKDKLVSLSKSPLINGKVIFPGFRDDLQALYSAFDIYAHTSIEGGGELTPFSVLYALAASVPVIATTAGDISEMVADGVNGFLVPEKNAASTADKLCTLASEPELRFIMGAAGLKLLNQKFTLSSMGNSIMKLYHNVLRIRDNSF
jgi:glycosyltransferase involved in cell wall biosynthesis